MSEINFKGILYTWWNERIEEDCILKRLDRIFGNNEFMQEFPTSEVHHLIRQGSDHAPLHMVCKGNQVEIIKPFGFLNFWINHKKFKEVVQQQWIMNVEGSPFFVVQQKMENLKRTLSNWSKKVYGNIFVKISTLEDVCRMKEQQLEVNPTEQNKEELAKSEEVLRKYYEIEEEYWKEKAGMQWFKEGERNTKFFHAYVNGKRKIMFISEIQTAQREIIHTTQNIGEKAVRVSQEQFKEEQRVDDYSMIDVIPKLITA